uniref:Uncharacterized protein n=1 Tax=Candidatus Kentrum sp. DK TaxID=2126562 RepID=A0A450S2F1_9GAMM|nr:MAG: hypothetical protein BECKDK2373B_GA0170837_101142 [Candidatus Kentron sp. DK]
MESRRPDIVTSVVLPHPVPCGNPDCDHDLRYDSRKLLICPGCHRPIWNRCGNEGCTEDHLLDRLKKASKEKPPTSYPDDCPECGEDMRTYWWRCKHHGDRRIPTDKEICPHCLEEHREGIREYDDVLYRPDLRAKACPGCISLHIPGSERAKIDPDLIKYYEDGINGHDSAHFPNLAKQHHLKLHLCVQQKRSHMLFPTCPEPGEGGGHHHLYRNQEGRFICPEHPKKSFYECFHCGYPIDKEALQDGKAECPRCLRKLRHCHYCSEGNNRLYEPQHKGKGKHEHCPHCGNHLVSQEPDKAVALNEDFDRPGYCRNFTDCTAARDLWCTSTDFDLETCRSCGAEGATLLNRKHVEKQIARCPVCLSLFGLPGQDGIPSPLWREGKGDIDALLAHFRGRMDGVLFRPEEPCPHCATRPAVMLDWAWGERHPGKEGDHERGRDGMALEGDDGNALYDREIHVEKYARNIPENFSFLDFIMMMEILMKHPSDVDALERLRETYFFRPYHARFPDLVRSLTGFFVPDMLTTQSVEKRLNRIRGLHEDELKRAGIPDTGKTGC